MTIPSDPSRRAEFIGLIERHQHRLLGFIFSLSHNQHDTEDLFQQASLVWWKKFEQFEPGSNFVGWACQIAQYEVFNYYRHNSRTKALFSDELQEQLLQLSGETSTDNTADQLDALGQCIERLPSADRHLLSQVYDESLPITAVAAHHGRSRKSIHNSLGRIRQVLQECVRRTLAREGV